LNLSFNFFNTMKIFFHYPKLNFIKTIYQFFLSVNSNRYTCLSKATATNEVSLINAILVIGLDSKLSVVVLWSSVWTNVKVESCADTTTVLQLGLQQTSFTQESNDILRRTSPWFCYEIIINNYFFKWKIAVLIFIINKRQIRRWNVSP